MIKEVASIVELFVIKEVETERKAFETERKSFEAERKAFTKTRKVRNIRNLSSRSRGECRFVARSEHASDALYFTADAVLRLAEITLLVLSAAPRIQLGTRCVVLRLVLFETKLAETPRVPVSVAEKPRCCEELEHMTCTH